MGLSTVKIVVEMRWLAFHSEILKSNLHMHIFLFAILCIYSMKIILNIKLLTIDDLIR